MTFHVRSLVLLSALSILTWACSGSDAESSGDGDGDAPGDGDSSGDGDGDSSATGGTSGDGDTATGGATGDGDAPSGGAMGDGDGDAPSIEGPGAGSSEIYQEVGGLVAVEAEHFASYDNKGAPRDYWYTSADFTPGITPDPDPNHFEGASGGVYLETLPDTRVTHDDPIQEGESIFNNAGTGPTLTYAVDFETAGTYYVWVRAYSTGGEDNGIHVGINGEFPESGQKLQFCSGKNQWTWSSNKRDSGGSACGVPHTITIEVPSPGQHDVHFSMREDGFEFDKWLMTTDSEYVPDGVGPDEVVE